MEPEAALLWSLKVSTYRLVCEVNGAVECMFGVGAQSPISDVGYPWLLSSPVPINWPREFNTVTAQVIKQMKVGYDHLENWVDVHNIIAVHWLKNHGFTFDEEPVLSQMGEPFYHFHWRR